MTYRSAAQKTRGRTLAYAGAGADSGAKPAKGRHTCATLFLVRSVIQNSAVRYCRADVHEITTVTRPARVHKRGVNSVVNNTPLSGCRAICATLQRANCATFRMLQRANCPQDACSTRRQPRCATWAHRIVLETTARRPIYRSAQQKALTTDRTA